MNSMLQASTNTLASLWKFIKRFRVELLLLILILPAIKDLLMPGYFTMHDDLQSFRLYEINKCFEDGQFPCRWVPDAGYGYGYPLMQFYPPMPYYPMQFLLMLGLGFFWPVKIMFALSFIFSGLGMYYLAKEFFGKWGGLLSALFYVYAPYHSVDVYVRGAQNEAWGMVWFPFVLLYIYKLITKKFSWNSFLLLAIALLGQLTSHNVMTLIFAPTAIIWAVFWIWRSKNYQSIKHLALSGILGVGLSAFFFIPVVLEQKFVHVDSMMSGYFNYMAHYADINQIFFSRFWGYGGSTWGPDDGMSFSTGHLQWIGAVLASLVAIFRFKKHKSSSMMIIMATVFGFAYAFLTHSRSLPVWQVLPLLQYAQFPWRLVALIVFYFSFAAGYLVHIKLPKIIKKIAFVVLAIAVIVWNLPFFKVERPTRVSFEEKTAGRQWELQVTGGIFDYLPRSAPFPPGEPAFTIPVYEEGMGGILNFRSGSNWITFDAHVSTENSRVMLPLFTYPGLETRVDGKRVNTFAELELGRVVVEIPQGLHSVSARINNTPLRTASDILTLVSILVFIKLAIHARRNR